MPIDTAPSRDSSSPCSRHWLVLRSLTDESWRFCHHRTSSFIPSPCQGQMDNSSDSDIQLQQFLWSPNMGWSWVRFSWKGLRLVTVPALQAFQLYHISTCCATILQKVCNSTKYGSGNDKCKIGRAHV